jgi:hypothetical protein
MLACGSKTTDGSSQREPQRLQVSEIASSPRSDSDMRDDAKPVVVGVADTSALATKHIRCIMQDRARTYWFATDGDGLGRFDGDAFVRFPR